MVIYLRLKNFIIPFTLLIVIVTLRISSYINDESYYDDFKVEFKKDFDFISLSKKFLGRFNFIYFSEQDFVVSSDDVFCKIDDNLFYVESNSNLLICKSDGVCVEISKFNDAYMIKLRSENIIVTYYDLVKPNISLYEYVKQGEVISEINYSYTVKYEN